jgi:uncharacterized protein YciI
VFFVAICLDKPDSHELRLQNRAAHLDYLRLNSGSIKTCGPFLSDDGTRMIGSLLVIEAEDRGTVDALLKRDPYRAVDLFQSIEVRPWRWVIGAPVP